MNACFLYPRQYGLREYIPVILMQQIIFLEVSYDA